MDKLYKILLGTLTWLVRGRNNLKLANTFPAIQYFLIILCIALPEMLYTDSISSLNRTWEIARKDVCSFFFILKEMIFYCIYNYICVILLYLIIITYSLNNGRVTHAHVSSNSIEIEPMPDDTIIT